jgi:4-aminobutyrate aminotransferase-like enzyme
MAGGTQGDIISLYPPLTFTQDHIDEMGQRLRATFGDVATILAG